METIEQMLERVGENRVLRVSEGLKILAKYCKNNLGIAAEHDVIYAGPERALKIVDIEDRRILKKLHWHVAGDDSEEDEDVVDASTVDEDDLEDDGSGCYFFFT